MRNLQDLRIVGVCSATECDSRKRHWHLPTHKTLTVTYTDHAPTIGGNNSYQGGTKVSKDELPQEDVRIVGREDHRQGKGRPRSRTLRAQRGDDLSPQGGYIWGATEPEPVAKQTILAKELLAAIASIKPGIVWKGPDYSMMTKWFNERLDHGWTEETCRRAIRMFIEDPGTVLAIGEKRPTVAFMGFVRRREAQFSETVTQQLREVTARMPEAYRRTQEARRQALERAERRGDRT